MQPDKAGNRPAFRHPRGALTVSACRAQGNERARAQLVDQFKRCLLDVLKGNGELAQNVEWDDADRALIRRWADDCTDDPEFASLLETIEWEARKLSRVPPLL